MFTTNTWTADDSRILSHRGYAIRKDALTVAQTRQLRSALSMMPRVAPEFSAGIEPFPIFFESPSRWYVPRFWGIENCGAADGYWEPLFCDTAPELTAFFLTVLLLLSIFIDKCFIYCQNILI